MVARAMIKPSWLKPKRMISPLMMKPGIERAVHLRKSTARLSNKGLMLPKRNPRANLKVKKHPSLRVSNQLNLNLEDQVENLPSQKLEGEVRVLPEQ